MSSYGESNIEKKYHMTEEIIAISKVFQKGKVQVPSDVRKMLGIKDGRKLVWKLKEGKIFVEAA